MYWFIYNINEEETPLNDNLEAMAKQLYDYWFVQFDFPDENGKPYKSSGGKMVWNEKLKREIPQGWDNCVLGDYIGRITNGLNPRKNFILGNGDNYYVTIRSLVGTTIDWNNCDRCDNEALSKINSRSQLQVGDIIFSAIGTIGRTYYILEEPRNWNISETSFTLRAKESVPNDFFYGMLLSDEIQIKADKAAMGSTLRCLVMDSLCSLQYTKIPNNMMISFSAKVASLYRQIHRNNKEIAELTKQRDDLLPLLMNGQATVNYHLTDNLVFECNHHHYRLYSCYLDLLFSFVSPTRWIYRTQPDACGSRGIEWFKQLAHSCCPPLPTNRISCDAGSNDLLGRDMPSGLLRVYDTKLNSTDRLLHKWRNPVHCHREKQQGFTSFDSAVSHSANEVRLLVFKR